MGTEQIDDEARWADARSVLDRTPTETAEERLRRWRRLRVLFVASVIVLCTAAGVVLALLSRGAFAEQPSDVPAWQVVAGLVIAGVGLVLQALGLVALWRVTRTLRAWRSPLAPLTRRQRGELLAGVRGHRLVEPARVPLARYLAEQRITQRHVIGANLGLVISFAGQAIASPVAWRVVQTVGYGLLLGVGWALAERDARQARRFLAEHPFPTG